MILNFKTMEETVIQNFRGGEKHVSAKMFADEKNRIMVIRLIPGATIGLHTHEGSSEVVYILEGSGKMLYDDGEERLEAGQAHYCPEGHSHSLINDTESDLIFFSIVLQQ